MSIRQRFALGVRAAVVLCVSSSLGGCDQNSDIGGPPVIATDDGSEQLSSPNGPATAPTLADLEGVHRGYEWPVGKRAGAAGLNPTGGIDLWPPGWTGSRY
jgi:hypothetical protein